MKHLLCLLCCIPFFAEAQVPVLKGKNTLKINASSLVARNYHFTYERKITRRVSLSVAYRTMPKGNLPFQSTFEDLIQSEDINFGRFQIGNTAITPELRLYVGKGNLKGFYIAPYMRFANFDLTAPVSYSTTSGTSTFTKEADFTGKIKSTSGGLMFGTQHRIFKILVIDIWIIGGHYGTSKGDLNFVATTPLTAQEQQSLKQNLDEIDPSPFKFTNTVNANGAQIKSDGPWAGIRGLGINLGFRF